MNGKIKFFSRIDVRILSVLLLLLIFIAVTVSIINRNNIRNIFTDNYTERILRSNSAMAGFLDDDDVKYYVDLLKNQDAAFKQRQVQFYFDREELHRLQNSGASEDELRPVIERLNDFHRETASLKDERYWDIISDLQVLKETGLSTYVYVLADTGLTAPDGSKLYSFIFDAEDSHTFGDYDTDGLGTCIEGEDYLAITIQSKTQMDYVQHYDGIYGELYYAYAPILDEHGNVLAVLGTDRDAVEMNTSISSSAYLFNVVFVLSFSFTVILIFIVLLINITGPLRSLTGTLQSVSKGSMHAAISEKVLKQRGEIGILAHALKNAIEESRKNINHLERTLNSIAAMICVTDPETDTLLFINDEMRRVFDVPRDSGSLKCYTALRGFDKRCDFCPCDILAKEPETEVVWEQKIESSNRTYRTFSRYIKWPDGKTVHLQHAVDITDILETQTWLTGQNIRLNLLISSLHFALWDADANYSAESLISPDNEIHYSEELLRMFGFENGDEFPNTLGSWFERIHPDDFDMVVSKIAAHLDDTGGNTPFDTEYRMKLKSGEYKWLRAFGAAQRDENGKPLRMIGATEDINDRKNAEREIEEKNDMIQVMFNNAPVGLTVFDENLKFIDCNDNVLQTFGVTKETYGEFFTRNLHSPEYQPDGSKSREKALMLQERVLKGENIRLSWLHRTPDNSPLQVELTLTRVKQNDKYVTLGYIYDMREQDKLRNELENALRKAESANQAKSAFLANMSHEIRTPMNAILGITEIELRKDTLPDDSKDALGKIYDSGGLLLGIINDILDFSKIEEGKLEIIPVVYNLPDLINETIQLNLMRYDSENIEFMLDVDENLPVNLCGDKLRIKQILVNILSNAFKYTDKGHVRMFIYCDPIVNPATGNDITLTIRVSDTGCGMTGGQLEKLFMEYTRFNMHTNRTVQGTGLGMSITKRLVELMGGTINVESEINKGTSFTIHLPQKRVNTHICGRETAFHLRNFDYRSAAISKVSHTMRIYMPHGKILIVDDMESNIYVTEGMLKLYGLQIESVKSGIGAIELIKSGKEYDIIFMDYMMPEMNGMEATKTLREMGYKSAIVALTANALAGQAELFLQNGFDAFLSKPIDSRELYTVLNRFVRSEEQS